MSVRAPVNVATARIVLFTALAASRAEARVGLRSIDGSHEADAGEDRDAGTAATADLTWLGLPLDGAPVTTSARAGIYAGYARRLIDSGRTHRRQSVTLLNVPAGETAIDDAVKGRVTFANPALGEIALMHGEQIDESFAATLDDALLGSGVVVNEDRQLERTARGLLVLAALDLTPPRYAHVGTLLPDDDGPLPLVAQLRRAGFLPGPVIDHLALIGDSPPGGEESPDWPARVGAFAFDRIGHAPAHFNGARLRALNARALRALPRERLAVLLTESMQRAGLLEDPVPVAASRWIATFLEAYAGEFATLGEALARVAGLRAEAVVVPALELERLRNRQVVFYLDAVGQYVDAQPELRGLPLEHDLPVIAQEFGISHDDAFAAVRMALTGQPDGPPLSFLFPLLGHDRILIRIGAISSHLLHGRGLEPIKYGPGGVPFRTIASGGPPPN